MAQGWPRRRYRERRPWWRRPPQKQVLAAIALVLLAWLSTFLPGQMGLRCRSWIDQWVLGDYPRFPQQWSESLAVVLARWGLWEPPAEAVMVSAPLSGQLLRPFHPAEHPGVDIAGNAGEPVTCLFAGQVIEIGERLEEGTLVKVESPGGLVVLYCGLESTVVALGDEVAAGELLGYLAAREPAHLHLEVWRGLTPLDPLPLLPR